MRSYISLIFILSSIKHRENTFLNIKKEAILKLRYKLIIQVYISSFSHSTAVIFLESKMVTITVATKTAVAEGKVNTLLIFESIQIWIGTSFRKNRIMGPAESIP